MAIPVQDVLLVDWSTNADARLTASPVTYGTTAGVAAQYHTLHDLYVQAYNTVVAARASGTRSASLTELKNQGRTNLLNFARPLYKQVQANASVSASAKIELGVVVPAHPAVRPVPAFAPGLSIVSVDGRRVRVRIFDPAHPTHKRMAAGVDGATVMSFVGAQAPQDIGGYKYEGGTSRAVVDVLFPESAAPGTQVWLTAFYFNERKQNGPACAPVGAVINYGGTLPAVA